jgi:hypothetical protein
MALRLRCEVPGGGPSYRGMGRAVPSALKRHGPEALSLTASRRCMRCGTALRLPSPAPPPRPSSRCLAGPGFRRSAHRWSRRAARSGMPRSRRYHSWAARYVSRIPVSGIPARWHVVSPGATYRSIRAACGINMVSAAQAEGVVTRPARYSDRQLMSISSIEVPVRVAVLAGGLGTRLSEVTELRSKPMVEIGGRPILWHNSGTT